MTHPAIPRYLALLALVLAVPATEPLHAVEPLGADDFRVSAMGGTGNFAYAATRPAVAYNSIDDEYLVVWAGDTNSAPFADNLWGIFGQRIDAATGAALGPDDFAVSGVIDGLPAAGPYDPAIAWNPDRGEYLVVWIGNTGFCCGQDYEVFARRVDAAGVPIGAPFRVSHMASAIDEHTYDAAKPDVVYNPTVAEYLVVWAGDDAGQGLFDDEFEIFAQRLSGVGAEIGVDDFRVSAVEGIGSPHFDAGEPAVTYNPVRQEYLVVWVADEDDPPFVDNEVEVYGQRLLGATGAEIGADDFRLSSTGPAGDPNFLVLEPAIAHDPAADRYLVAWTGAASAPALFTWELEIFVQLLDGEGGEIGPDRRITSAGPDGDTSFDAQKPEVAHDAAGSGYFVSYSANDDGGGMAPNEIEIFLQELDRDGVEIGRDDDRISDMGTTGSGQFGAFFPAVAANGTGEAFAVWRGDDDTGGLVDHEYEIFGQRFRSAVLFVDGFESGDLSAWLP